MYLTAISCKTDFFFVLASSFSAQASGLSELIGPPPLAYKKWRFDGQKHITDIASCGEVLLCIMLQQLC